jgi:hypothetical protein
LDQVFPTEAAGKKINDLIRAGGVLDMIRNRIAPAVMRDETKETITIDDGLLINGLLMPLRDCTVVPSRTRSTNGDTSSQNWTSILVRRL